MDIFILQIAIIFLPGIIWERIDALFALTGTPSQLDIIRRSFVFGLVAYILTYGFYVLLGWPFYFLQIDKDRQILTEFEAPRMYLARKADNIDIEFPYKKQPGEDR